MSVKNVLIPTIVTSPPELEEHGRPSTVGRSTTSKQSWPFYFVKPLLKPFTLARTPGFLALLPSVVAPTGDTFFFLFFSFFFV